MNELMTQAVDLMTAGTGFCILRFLIVRTRNDNPVSYTELKSVFLR